MIVGQNYDAGARLESVSGQPGPHRLGHVPQLGVGAALNPVAALDLQGDILGPVLDALHKAIVKSGHWFAEILHETGTIA